MQPTEEQILSEYRELVKARLSLNSELQELLDYLPDSEYELILYMASVKIWKGAVPPPPKDFKPGSGNVELGMYLYWINNSNLLNLSEFTPEQQRNIKLLMMVMSGQMSKSLMTSVNYDFFKTNELIYSDGTVLSFEKYADFDQGWVIAFLNLVETLLRDLWYNNSVFPTATPVIPLKGATTGKLSIAVLGDWGTGNNISQAVMNKIVSLKPDYILHVGDTYYSGTPLATDPNGNYYYHAGEEQVNLLKQWPPVWYGRSFSINSNHEMYSGANGLFITALRANANPPGLGSPFSLQKGAGCFALTFADWTLFGLDSAYYGTVKDAFMSGSIGASNGTQSNFIRSLKPNPKKTMIFTHHNGFNYDCSGSTALWAQVKGALGADPYAWYWGHVHNGIVYKSPITIPNAPPFPGFTTNAYCRCLGHAAIPYGPASALNGKPLDWRATNPLPGKPKQLANGFAVLSFESTNNQVTNITERFYDISTSQQPSWTKRIL